MMCLQRGRKWLQGDAERPQTDYKLRQNRHEKKHEQIEKQPQKNYTQQPQNNAKHSQRDVKRLPSLEEGCDRGLLHASVSRDPLSHNPSMAVKYLELQIAAIYWCSFVLEYLKLLGFIYYIKQLMTSSLPLVPLFNRHHRLLPWKRWSAGITDCYHGNSALSSELAWGYAS